MANRVIHFEIQAEDIERAKGFYGDVFGWQFQDWPMPDGSSYVGVMTAEKDSKEPGINGGILKRPCPAPALEQGTNAFTCSVQVEDYDSIEKKILAEGGKVALPKFAIPGMAWQGYYIDTEGNTFGIHEPDSNAK